MKLASLALALIVAASPLASFAQDMTTSADEQVLIKQIQTNRRGVYAEYLKMTDAESKAFWPVYDEYEAQSKRLDLKVKYTDRIAKVLPGRKALRYAQIESRIENLTQRNIYTLIPLAR